MARLKLLLKRRKSINSRLLTHCLRGKKSGVNLDCLSTQFYTNSPSASQQHRQTGLTGPGRGSTRNRA
jgi:hypothetical protein